MKNETKNLLSTLTNHFLFSDDICRQVLRALGGKIELGDQSSKQGGLNFLGARWEDESSVYDISNILNLDHLISYCRRNELFYTILPNQDDTKVKVVIQQNSFGVQAVGLSSVGTFAAALIKFRSKK